MPSSAPSGPEPIHRSETVVSQFTELRGKIFALEMIDDPIAKDQNAHQRPGFLLSMSRRADRNVPAGKIEEYALQFFDNGGPKHLQILHFDTNKIQAPIVVYNP